MAVKGELTLEERARVAAFLAPDVAADTLCASTAASYTVLVPGGRQLRLQVYAAEDPPVRKAVQLQAPVLFFVATEVALADEDTPDDLADLCEQRPYVALLVPTAHAAAEALLATAKRHAWYATAIDLATVPPQGLDQLLASPAWNSAAPLMQAHAIATALGAAGRVLHGVLAQEGDALMVKRAHNQQQTTYWDRQMALDRTARPERRVQSLYKRRFDDLQRQASNRTNDLLEERYGTI